MASDFQQIFMASLLTEEKLREQNYEPVRLERQTAGEHVVHALLRVLRR